MSRDPKSGHVFGSPKVLSHPSSFPPTTTVAIPCSLLQFLSFQLIPLFPLHSLYHDWHFSPPWDPSAAPPANNTDSNSILDPSNAFWDLPACIPKMHQNNNIIAFLKNLPHTYKILLNEGISKCNETWDIQWDLHIADLTAFPDIILLLLLFLNLTSQAPPSSCSKSFLSCLTPSTRKNYWKYCLDRWSGQQCGDPIGYLGFHCIWRCLCWVVFYGCEGDFWGKQWYCCYNAFSECVWEGLRRCQKDLGWNWDQYCLLEEQQGDQQGGEKCQSWYKKWRGNLKECYALNRERRDCKHTLGPITWLGSNGQDKNRKT